MCTGWPGPCHGLGILQGCVRVLRGDEGRLGLDCDLAHETQASPPVRVEVALHANLRKLVGEEEAWQPEALLPRQRPRPPAPLGQLGKQAARARGPRHRGAKKPLREAHGLLLIGDLGWEDGEEAWALARPPALGFLNLGPLALRAAETGRAEAAGGFPGAGEPTSSLGPGPRLSSSSSGPMQGEGGVDAGGASKGWAGRAPRSCSARANLWARKD
jgi:hypothetical protein